MTPDTPQEPQRPRVYRQRTRARGAEATRERVLNAAAELLEQRPAAAVSLDAVAAAGRTTVPTVLRHFPTKDALVAAALSAALTRLRAARPRVAPGDHLAAAAVLATEYEEHAALLRAAEAATPHARRDLVEAPRRLHRDWLARTFARTLSPLPPVVHRRRLAQLVAVSGPAPWRTLRETEHLTPGQAQAALAELLHVLSR
jgi:AcrR family transcriptional regulator